MLGKQDSIVIKKVKKGGHGGHHGGAWKVAYADFVTAMMAFFLLMWLLTATPVENLQGLADYFSPTLGLQGKMGIGFSGGRSPNTEGVSQGDWASQGLIFGAPPSGPIIRMPKKENKLDVDNGDSITFEKVQKDIAETLNTPDLKDSVQFDLTPEGLNINITDHDQRPMFEPGTANLQAHARKILAKIANLIKDIPNYVQVVGHTARGEVIKEGYGPWELSAERANTARRYFVEGGMDPEQVARVVAKADYVPLKSVRPEAGINARVTVTLLKQSILSGYKRSMPDDIKPGMREKGLESYIKDKQQRGQDATDSNKRNFDGYPGASTSPSQ